MKKRWMLLVILGISILVAFSGCEFFAAMLTSVSGTVVDARSALLTGLGDITVSLVTKDGTTKYSTTTDSDGSFIISGVDPGDYVVKAEDEKGEWFFIPKDVYVGGMAQDLGNILGIELDTNKYLRDSALSFILVWNNVYQDVDGYLTYAKGDGSGGTANTSLTYSTTFTNPYEAYTTGTGFGPDDSGYRAKIYWDNKESLNTVYAVMGNDSNYPEDPAVNLDRDDRDGSGPEVITVRSLPYWIDSSDTNAAITPDGTDSGNYLPLKDPDGNSVYYSWVGVMEYYIDGYNKDSSTAGYRADSDNLISSTDGTGADAVLYVVRGSELLGKFPVPAYANLRTMDMVRVNLFVTSTGYSYFQIVPNIRSIDYTDIKSVNSVPISGFFGPKRR